MTFPILLRSLFNCLTMNAVLSKYSSLWCSLCAVWSHHCDAMIMIMLMNADTHMVCAGRIKLCCCCCVFLRFFLYFWIVYESKSVLFTVQYFGNSQNRKLVFLFIFPLHTSTPSKTKSNQPSRTHRRTHIHSFAFNRSPGQPLAH